MIQMKRKEDYADRPGRGDSPEESACIYLGVDSLFFFTLTLS